MKNKSANKWIYNQTKPFLAWIFFISFLNVAAALLYVYLADLSQKIIDFADNKTNHTFLICGSLIFLSILFYVIIEISISLISVKISSKMNMALRNRIFTTLLGKKYSQVTKYHSGDLVNRFSSDTEQIVSGTVVLIPQIVSIITKIIAGVSALCLKKPFFAFVVIIVGVTMPFASRFLSNKYKALHKAVQQSEGVTRSFFQESLENIVVIKTFSGELPFKLKLGDSMNKNHTLKMKRNVIAVIIAALIYLFFNVCYYGVLVWGAAEVAAGTLTVGTLVYFLQLISVLRSPLQNVSGIMPKYYATVASAERIMELENLQDENTNDTLLKPIEFNTIVAENLSFAYDSENVFSNNDFAIKKGTITAITGHSGSGKTTLFKLLLGLLPITDGSLTFDGKTPINETTRCMFSYVPQGNLLISGTIRDNISLCNANVSEDKIIEVAKTAAIYDFISELPNGFDTVIAERGQGLSEGQIQRIAIARALLFDAPILLLDEATSALDEATETLLLNNLKQYTDKTIIFITHRNTSLKICNNILNIKDGKFTQQNN